ncbi:hypothetical protein AWZ03_008142 [Drosophila navojoa]|uniref:Uncharacterized protein n=1 Tax=Drosophila navojoa TaxID=7232 RepID=A0A484B946_DRONA|nr:hypothetical protein AWZ03_008142 [Drosophila navojoa]
MDFNFADLKKEAANTAEDIFNAASKQVSNTYDDLLGDANVGSGSGSANVSGEGVQDDNAHTEKYFANEQKNLDFGDPQAFVQRMSAGAKEAQEQLDAKFAQKADDFGDFLKQGVKDVKQNVGELTSDFMNVERGMFGDANKVAPPSAPAAAPAPVAAAAATVKPVHDQEEDLLGLKPVSSAPLQPFEPTAPSTHDQFYDDDDDDFLIKPTPAAAPVAPAVPAPAAAPTPAVANKDSDTDSPSVSYTPSPAKKPIADALKEQDNEKFISSEDLLSDFKDVAATAAVPAPAAVPFPSSTPALITDLDDDEIVAKPAAKVEPPTVVPPKVEPPKVVPPKVEPAKPEPAKQQPPTKQQQQQQPKIVSVEEIFYKYGLGK